MKSRIIRIKDVSDINASKATVYDLNNRYIDAQGQMYGLRYDRLKKKIEIIRIMRAPASTAPLYTQKIIESRRNKSESKGDEEKPVENNVDNEAEKVGDENEEAPAEVRKFNPDEYINETFNSMKSHKNRLNGIIVNINNSQLYSNINKSQSSNLENLFRNLDIDGIQRIDNVMSLHKELTSYPRSISYYIAKLDNKSRDVVDLMDDEKRQMRFVYFSEMLSSIRSLYRTLFKIITELQSNINEIDIDELGDLSHNDKQKIGDSTTSIDNTIKEIKLILNGTNQLEEFILEVDNF